MSGWGGADSDRDAEEESAGNFAQYDYLSRIIQGAISGAAWNLTPAMLCELQRLTGSGDTPGVYRTRAVEIEWSKHTPPDAADVPKLVDEMCAIVNGGTLQGTTLAAYVMWGVNWIHPFADGNGRTALAACYFVVCRWLKFEPASKPALPDLIAQEPIKYRKCLETADAHWDRRKKPNVSDGAGFSGGS